MSTNVRKFMAVASKSQCQMAGELAEEIKAAIYRHAEAMPLPLVLGILRIVERELLDDAERAG